MENTKKSFPIASIFFILFFIANVVRVIVSSISTVVTYTRLGIDDSSMVSTIIINVAVLMLFLPFLLMGFFSLNTTKKPSVGYIVALVLALFGPCITVIGGITSLINIFSYGFDLQSFSSFFTYLIQPLLFLALVVALIYAIVAKVCKKPSKIFNFWFIFPIPFVIFFIAQLVSSCLNILVAIESTKFSTTSSILSILGILLFVFGYLLLTIGFFCVSRQFAMVNKTLPVEDVAPIEEATEITE